MIELTVNGESVEVEDAGLGALLAELGTSPRGVAVAVNGEVVPRSAWESYRLANGDRVEVLSAAAGG